MPKKETAKRAKSRDEADVQTVLNALRRRAEKLGIKTPLVASTKGESASPKNLG
jgi:hypothetical protein